MDIKTVGKIDGRIRILVNITSDACMTVTL